MNVNFC